MEISNAENILCGINPVKELLDISPDKIDTIYVRRGTRGKLDAILSVAKQAKVRFKFVDDISLSRILANAGANGTTLSNTARHQGIVARLLSCDTVEFKVLLETIKVSPLPLAIIADQIIDPGNLGTIARTLYSLGGSGIVVPKNNSAYLGPVARSAAAGVLERMPVSKVVNIARSLDIALDMGFAVYGADASTDKSINVFDAQLNMPALLVLGNEERGIRPNVAKRCQVLLNIPMARNFNSLNVAQAGAICIAEFARRKQLEQNI